MHSPGLFEKGISQAGTPAEPHSNLSRATDTAVAGTLLLACIYKAAGENGSAPEIKLCYAPAAITAPAVTGTKKPGSFSTERASRPDNEYMLIHLHPLTVSQVLSTEHQNHGIAFAAHADPAP
jgi:hypothetical protein